MRSATTGAKLRRSPKLWHSSTGISFAMRRSFRTRAPSESIQVRRFLLHQFPYKVLIVNLPDQIVVIAFAHAKRKPGYWLKRIP